MVHNVVLCVFLDIFSCQLLHQSYTFMSDHLPPAL